VGSPAGYGCLPLASSPEHGTISFDNVAVAVMTVIQVVTMQGWSGIMDVCQGAHTVWVGVFFILLVVTGPLFAMKVCALPLPYLALPCLTLSYLALPYLAVPYLFLPCLAVLR